MKYIPADDILELAAQNLPSEPTPAREIWERAGLWTVTTFRQALNHLAREGRATVITDVYRGGPRHLYSRKVATSA